LGSRLSSGDCILPLPRVFQLYCLLFAPCCYPRSHCKIILGLGIAFVCDFCLKSRHEGKAYGMGL
jgi:hypothetical protein